MMTEAMPVAFLTPEQEAAMKASIPWADLDRDIRYFILDFSRIPGLATVSSCAGHIRINAEGFLDVDRAYITLCVSREMAMRLLFNAVPRAQIDCVQISYYEDNSMRITLECDPAERDKLGRLAAILLGSRHDTSRTPNE